MSPVRARRERSKRLALELTTDYRTLVNASGTDEIQRAAIILGDRFNQNIEFVINVLRDYGGLQPTFEREPAAPANDLPAVPELLRAGCDVDMPRKA